MNCKSKQAVPFPQWRAKPCQEAYWEEHLELSRKKIPIPEWLLYFLMNSAVSIAGRLFFMDIHTSSFDSEFVLFLSWFVTMLLPSIFLLYFVERIIRIFREIPLIRKYGFVMFRLNRPDISQELKAMFAERDAFHEDEFRKYWNTESEADTACNLLAFTGLFWRSEGKMFYPDDPLFFVFSGRSTPFSKLRIQIPFSPFQKTVWKKYPIPFSKLCLDNTFADMVQLCLSESGTAKHPKHSEPEFVPPKFLFHFWSQPCTFVDESSDPSIFLKKEKHTLFPYEWRNSARTLSIEKEFDAF